MLIKETAISANISASIHSIIDEFFCPRFFQKVQLTNRVMYMSKITGNPRSQMKLPSHITHRR
jgi:hypothetical protein